MNKEVVVHTNNGILFSYKKERIWVSFSEVGETGAYYTSDIMLLVFLWLTSLSLTVSRSIHVAADHIISFFLTAE